MYLNIAHFFDHFFLLIFPTAVIAIEGDWALTYGEALALGTSMYVAFAVATLPAGWLGDHVDRPKLITIFFLGCGAASIFTGLSTGTSGFIVGLGLLGAFTALYHPVGMAMVIELAERPGRALAINGVFGNMGLAAAALVTGLLAERFGWRSAFIVPGLASIAIGLLHAWQLTPGKLDAQVGNKNDGDQFRRPGPLAPNTCIRHRPDFGLVWRHYLQCSHCIAAQIVRRTIDRHRRQSHRNWWLYGPGVRCRRFRAAANR